MIQLKGMRFITSFAQCWLNNFPFFNKASFFSETLFTDKSSFFHFRNNIRTSNYNSTKCYKFFDMSWVELSYSIDLF